MPYDATIYHNNPRVEIIENLINKDVANHFIELGIKDLGLSMVVGSASTEDALDTARTSRTSWIAHDRTQKTLTIARKISEIVGIPLKNAESFQLIHYGETQEYQPHFDAFDPHTEGGKFHLQRGGQRLKTALIYLNTVPKGGGTIFPAIDLTIAAKLGRMVVFENCQAGTQTPHPLSLHGGMPVIKGKKWALNLWFHESEFI